LNRVPVDLIFIGDYQPVERKYKISRKMLEVCRDLGFPVFVLERSPLVLRDLDIIQSINAIAPSAVAFSIISTSTSPNYEKVHWLEHLAPPAPERFGIIEKFAATGILTGTCMMPILPGLCDDKNNLEAIIRSTADHGGKFVLASGLTLVDQQRNYFFNVLNDRFPDLLAFYQNLYPPGSYAPSGGQWRKIGLQIRELCDKYGIDDRLPRPIIPGDKHALNKRIVEKLADELYDMDINNKPNYQVWAYRKAAWAIEDLEQDIGLIYRTMGLKGLQSIPNLGASISRIVDKWIKAGG